MSSQTRVLYLSSSQFSGTTLASFLLNCHPDIATVGHTTGWRLANESTFTCSCGLTIDECPVFSHIRLAYAGSGLEFRADDFGTAFRLTSNQTWNYYLTEGLPVLRSNLLEDVRNHAVRLVPVWRARLKRQLLANRVFVRAALEKLNAKVYLDNSHTPYRLRLLSRMEDIDLRNLHLVRDPRGVVLSLMTNAKHDPEHGTRAWLRRQRDVVRIAKHVPTLTVRYEDLCRRTNEELKMIHEFVGLDPASFNGDFKAANHHILGNRMRLGDGQVRLDERWRDNLDAKTGRLIERHLLRFARSHANDPVAGIIRSYLEER